MQVVAVNPFLSNVLFWSPWKYQKTKDFLEARKARNFMKTANLIWNWYLDMLSSLAGMEKESIKDDDDDDDTPLKC